MFADKKVIFLKKKFSQKFSQESLHLFVYSGYRDSFFGLTSRGS